MKKYYMNHSLKDVYAALDKNYLKKDKLSVKVVKNGTVLPGKKDLSENPQLWCIGGVVDEEYHFIDSSCNKGLFGGNYEINEDFVDFVDEDVIFMGPFIAHWGHFICDQISRLWYVLDHPQKYKIAYCGYNFGDKKTDLHGNFLQFMESIGLSRKQFINIQYPTRFRNVIIPDFSFIAGQFYTKEFVHIMDVVVNNVMTKMKNQEYFEKIYFSRRKLGVSKELGEDALEKILKKNGFKIMYPEQLDFFEQIYFFNKASDVAMISGSIAHNLMFCKNKNNAFIFNKTFLINNYQLIIDDITKSNIHYIDSSRNFRQVLFGVGPFVIHINKNVRHFCDEHGYQKIKNIRNVFCEAGWFFKQYRLSYKDKKMKHLLREQIKNYNIKQLNKN